MCLLGNKSGQLWGGLDGLSQHQVGGSVSGISINDTSDTESSQNNTSERVHWFLELCYTFYKK